MDLTVPVRRSERRSFPLHSRFPTLRLAKPHVHQDHHHHKTMAPSKATTDMANLRLKQLSNHILTPHKTDYPVLHYASTEPTTRLKDKVAIITGCNSEKGIGRAAATCFAANGAKAVVIADLAKDNLPTWAEELGNRYPETKIEWKDFDAAGLSPPCQQRLIFR